ncbi:hypothetical protein IFM89_033470 [Coptis chinensis]|uniref:AMP-activated protein kinase glycogen-binding domain-containing protein n=1 Tax=Coptis chinensis TaxID=261450 RepID=A0A835HZK1_9MAGN|nr:hypothetical protein IFM89_033470 [Coptis chinensis]
MIVRFPHFQLLVPPLQIGDTPPTFNHIWINDPHDSLDAPQEQGIPTLITWTFGGNIVAVQGSWDNWTSRRYCRGQERTTPFSWCFHLVYISTSLLWTVSVVPRTPTNMDEHS